MRSPDASAVHPARQFFEELRAAHASAEAAAGRVDRYLRIAERTIHLRFAGDGLVAALTRALAHVVTASTDEADVELRIWDTVGSGVAPPRAPWKQAHVRRNGEIEGFNADGIRTAFLLGSNTFCTYDERSRSGLFWVEDAHRLDPWIRGSPLRSHISWALGDTNTQMVHAGAVGTEHGGVLVTGRSGSGKSTTTLACLGTGLRLAGDDMVVVRLGSPSSTSPPTVHTVYGNVRLERDHVRRFPRLAPLGEGLDGQDKVAVYLNEHLPDALGTGFPLRAIVVPRVEPGGVTRLVPVTLPECLAALAPTTMFLLPGNGGVALAAMARMIRSVPCHGLALGADMDCVPDLLCELIAR